MKKTVAVPVLETLSIIGFTLAMGIVDYATGYYLSFFVFYFIPIAFVAARHGAKSAYALSVFCALTWFASDQLAKHPYPNVWMAYWNTAVRLIAFVVVAYTVARIHSLLTSARNEVKTLQSFLPICAKCKKIRDDQGSWQAIEAYISEHAEVSFSHGLCEQCAAKYMRDINDRIKVK